ncbi:MAG TPA: DUF3426 domain-containing protein, partial [Janthinobacterium sp.]|nr:DUF3426 domain-containing protein [Janthinobacterium sp.]
APAQQFMEPPLESPSELAADPFVDLPIEASLDPFLDPHTQLPVEQATEPRLESSDKLPAALLVELPLEVPVDLSSELLVELPVELPIDLSAELLVELPVDPFFELHEPVHDAGAEELAQPATPYAEPADPQAFEPSAPEHFEPAPAHDAEPSESHHFEPPEPPGGKREPSFAALLTNHDEHILAIAAPAYELPETAAPTRAAEVKADDIDEPGFVKQVRRRERSGKAMRIAMGLGSVALLITLLGQGVSTFRNQLAARLPQIKPALVSACAMLDCRVELPAQIEAIAIEQGELQSLSESSFSYASVLHNQSGTAQAWPDIELILNDAADKPVLRRVITPREYLPPTTDVAKGFATHSEQAVKLYFELAQLKASGYHIAVFYP